MVEASQQIKTHTDTHTECHQQKHDLEIREGEGEDVDEWMHEAEAEGELKDRSQCLMDQ